MDSKGCTPPKKNLNECVKLNIGGYIFQTTIGTLVSHDGMLKRMFGNNFEIQKDPDGYVFIDRDGQYFSEILNFLRIGTISLSRPRNELESILVEAAFYQIEPLIWMLKDKLSGTADQEVIALIDSPDRVTKIIEEALGPVLYLEIVKGYEEDGGFSILREAFELHKGGFQFIIHFIERDARSIIPRSWIIYQGGKGLTVTQQMERDPNNEIARFFAMSGEEAKKSSFLKNKFIVGE